MKYTAQARHGPSPNGGSHDDREFNLGNNTGPRPRGDPGGASRRLRLSPGAVRFTSIILHGAGWEPLQRIAALLLGPDAAPPPADISLTILGMALLIHLPLAALYGRWVGAVVRRVDSRWTAGVGVVFGLALYAFNFELLAPNLFPWFTVSRNAITAFDHALFGLVAAIVYGALSRRVGP